MQVKQKLIIDTSHSIEIGLSTWDSDEVSIRNRYDLPNGKFSQHNSSEVPIYDIAPMIKFACKHDALTPDELKDIIASAVSSLQSQGKL